MNFKNQIYTGAQGRKSLLDFQEPDREYEDIVIFIHGYKGYKDWGAWNLVQSFFVSGGKAFCKFNMSHNGGTTDHPVDFPDPHAFSINCYSYELEDVHHIIDWIGSKIDLTDKKIHLIGHSRGGGVAILAAHHPKVASVTTWAGISNIESRFPIGDALKEWKEKDYYTVYNARTKQDMIHRYSFYEDWLKNKDKLNIELKAKDLNLPALHIHGDKDEAVPLSEADNLSMWTEGKLFVISKGNHTFDTYQPYDKEHMPSKLDEVCNLTLQFINKID